MQRAAKNPKPPGPQASAVTHLPSAPDVVRISRPANDNMPLWTLRAGRAIIVIGGVVLASLIIAALVYA